MPQTALITGASAGIGSALSRILAREGFGLVLSARDRGRLETLATELAARHALPVTVIPADLSRPEAPRELHAAVQAAGQTVDLLVNNAGIGFNGPFTEIPAERQADLIQINVTALTVLCRLFGADMAQRGAGRILNVASTAAFQPGPYMSTYYASKAYVLMFSEGLRAELRPRGVTVTVLCPGPTRTEFFARADMLGTRLERSPLAMNADRVAEAAYRGLAQGRPVVVPGLVNRLLALAVRLTPRPLATAIAGHLNRR